MKTPFTNAFADAFLWLLAAVSAAPADTLFGAPRLSQSGQSETPPGHLPTLAGFLGRGGLFLAVPRPPIQHLTLTLTLAPILLDRGGGFGGDSERADNWALYGFARGSTQFDTFRFKQLRESCEILFLPNRIAICACHPDSILRSTVQCGFHDLYGPDRPFAAHFRCLRLIRAWVG